MPQLGEPSRDRALPRDFEQLFREFAPYVLRVLPRMGVAERDVDDVAQEVFLAVYRGLPSFEGRSALKTWVYGICLRVCGNYRKRAHRRREWLTSVPPAAAEPNAGDAALEHHRRLAALDAALDTLPDVQRTVFVLHEVEQLSIVEIAAIEGCSKFTLYARLYAARRAVRTHLAESFPEVT